MAAVLYHGEPNGPSLSVLAALEESGLAIETKAIELLKGERHALPEVTESVALAMAVEGEGPVLVSDGEAMRHMALAGAGIARLSRWHVGPDIAAGRLVALLEPFNPGDNEVTHAVYVGQGKHLPARVRAFLDFLVETVRMI